MNIFRIPKKNGSWRTIYAPDREEKENLRWHARRFGKMAAEMDLLLGVQHGFTAGRSPVTNAMAHMGWDYTLCFDLKDFFDSVTPETLMGWDYDGAPATLGNSVPPCCFVDGAARQGLPTSPALANIAAVRMDREIVALGNASGRFGRSGRLFVYTRYADDLSFSFDLWSVGQMLLQEVPKIVERHGFALNPNKTRLQASTGGRRIITGVAVGAGVTVPRAMRRRLRAARHQLANGLRGRGLRRLLARQRELERKHGDRTPLHGLLLGHVRGLEEWCRLRLPKQAAPKTAVPNRPRQVAPRANRVVADSVTPSGRRQFDFD